MHTLPSAAPTVPMGTTTRLGWIAPLLMLRFDVDGVEHEPSGLGGEAVRYVPAVPLTPVRLNAAAVALPSLGMPPLDVTSMARLSPGPSAPVVHPVPPRLSQTRAGEMGWKVPM